MNGSIITGNVFLNNQFGEVLIINGDGNKTLTPMMEDGVLITVTVDENGTPISIPTYNHDAVRKFSLNLLRQVIKLNSNREDDPLVIRSLYSDSHADTTEMVLLELMAYNKDIEKPFDIKGTFDEINNSEYMHCGLISFTSSTTVRDIYKKIHFLHKNEGMNVLFLSDMFFSSLTSESVINDENYPYPQTALGRELHHYLKIIIEYCKDNDILLILSNPHGSPEVLNFLGDRVISIKEGSLEVVPGMVESTFVDVKVLRSKNNETKLPYQTRYTIPVTSDSKPCYYFPDSF